MNPEARCTIDLRDNLIAGNGDLQFTRSVSESDRSTPNLITPYTIVYTTMSYCYKSYNFNIYICITKIMVLYIHLVTIKACFLLGILLSACVFVCV